MIQKVNGEIAIGLFLLIVSILYGSLAVSFPKGENEVGPAFVPCLISLGLFILSILLIMNGRKIKLSSFRVQHKQVQLFVYLILYVVCLSLIGFIIDTLILTFLLSRLYGIKGYFKSILSSVVTTLIIYLLFQVLLHVPLSNL